MSKAFVKELFNPKGRWNRKKYWLYPMVLIIPFAIIMGLMAVTQGNDMLMKAIGGLYLILNIAATYVFVVTIMKRLRDLNKNPWMTLLCLVPFANIYLSVICGFFKGTVGPNKYGPDPLGGKAPVVDLASPETTGAKKASDISNVEL